MIDSLLDAGSVRVMTGADIELVLRWRNSPEIRRYMYTQREIGLAEHRDWYEHASREAGRYLLIFEYSNQPAGYISFHVKHDSAVAHWGFYVAPDSPKGTGRKLGIAALCYAFKTLRFHKICGEALAYNDKSIRFHLSLGFSVEGTLREQHRSGNKYHDVMCFGLLASEWQDHRYVE